MLIRTASSPKKRCATQCHVPSTDTARQVGAWFKEKQQMDELPPSLWENEDKDKDGFISWEEFSGPKGSAPPSGEDADETRDEL